MLVRELRLSCALRQSFMSIALVQRRHNKLCRPTKGTRITRLPLRCWKNLHGLAFSANHRNKMHYYARCWPIIGDPKSFYSSVAPCQNHSDWKLTAAVKSRGQISYFLTPCKIREGFGEMSESVFGCQKWKKNNLLCTFDGQSGRLVCGWQKERKPVKCRIARVSSGGLMTKVLREIKWM